MIIKVTKPEYVRFQCQRYAFEAVQNNATISPGGRGAIVGAFARAITELQNMRLDAPELSKEGIDIIRYQVWGYLFTPVGMTYEELQSEDLSDAHFKALEKWIGAEKVRTAPALEQWVNRPAFLPELAMICTKAKEIFSGGVQIKANGAKEGEVTYIEVEKDSQLWSTMLMGALPTEVKVIKTWDISEIENLENRVLIPPEPPELPEPELEYKVTDPEPLLMRIEPELKPDLPEPQPIKSDNWW